MKIDTISLIKITTILKKKENVIPIWGEEIIINKRKVKLGEIVIKKYEVTETKKVEMELSNRKINYTST